MLLAGLPCKENSACLRRAGIHALHACQLKCLVFSNVKHTDVMSRCFCMQISNATTVHVRRPGNPKKWRARILCEGIICDLALLTVDEDEFWSGDLMSLQFVDVPELQVA